MRAGAECRHSRHGLQQIETKVLHLQSLWHLPCVGRCPAMAEQRRGGGQWELGWMVVGLAPGRSVPPDGRVACLRARLARSCATPASFTANRHKHKRGPAGVQANAATCRSVAHLQGDRCQLPGCQEPAASTQHIRTRCRCAWTVHWAVKLTRGSRRATPSGGPAGPAAGRHCPSHPWLWDLLEILRQGRGRGAGTRWVCRSRCGTTNFLFTAWSGVYDFRK